MARKTIETRAGLNPSDKNLPFTITTAQCEEYLQKKVDILCNRDKSLPNNVDLRLYTTSVGRKFVPFVVVLPMSVLVDDDKTDKDIDPIFSSNESGGVQHLQKPFMNLFKSYVYDKNDIRAFNSNEWRRARDVSRNAAEQIKRMAIPRISSVKGGSGRVPYVTFLIDPIRLFHDMLIIPDDNKDFLVDIPRWQKIKTGEYKYFVERCVKKGRRRNEPGFAEELNQIMRGGRRG